MKRNKNRWNLLHTIKKIKKNIIKKKQGNYVKIRRKIKKNGVKGKIDKSEGRKFSGKEGNWRAYEIWKKKKREEKIGGT